MVGPRPGGDGGTGPVPIEESQAPTAGTKSGPPPSQGQALDAKPDGSGVPRANLNQADKRVKGTVARPAWTG
jgi:hypothetical protein